MADTNNANDTPQKDIRYCHYTDDSQMPPIMRLMEADLSEPYSVYTYQYFIHNWPKLCWLVSLYKALLDRFFAFSAIIFVKFFFLDLPE